ncbi:MAG: EAL domain-containing protein [Planctomycetota bacterium]
MATETNQSVRRFLVDKRLRTSRPELILALQNRAQDASQPIDVDIVDFTRNAYTSVRRAASAGRPFSAVIADLSDDDPVHAREAERTLEHLLRTDLRLQVAVGLPGPDLPEWIINSETLDRRRIYPLDLTGDATTFQFHLDRIMERWTISEHVRDGIVCVQADPLHDGLTGLANRALLLDRIRTCIERQRRRHDYHFALLFVDLDRFNVVNDGLGHEEGDRLLIAVSRRLRRCLRQSDTVARATEHDVARIGGDEFFIILDDLQHHSDATRVARRFLHALEQPFELSNQEIFISASIGIALSDNNYRDPDHMLRDADTAMYRAKADGRSCYAVFDQSMHDEAIERLRLETDLRHAVDRNEFRLMYQPLVRLTTGTIEGFEALIRWEHPERGTVSPVDFIPIAEETGLIVPIGRWVLRESCRQLADWRRRLDLDDDFSVSVNISRNHMQAPDLVPQLRSLLEEYRLEGRHINVEITESVLMENPNSASRTLAEIRDMGIELHMDDFGTGYSSLSCLHHFPISKLKIDREFINNMGQDEEHAAIVHAIVALAHHLRLQVTAEGIETRNQLEQILGMGCEIGQGYYFAKPLTPADAESVLNTDHSWLRSA